MISIKSMNSALRVSSENIYAIAITIIMTIIGSGPSPPDEGNVFFTFG
jgi:hypothetical protein